MHTRDFPNLPKFPKVPNYNNAQYAQYDWQENASEQIKLVDKIEKFIKKKKIQFNATDYYRSIFYIT